MLIGTGQKANIDKRVKKSPSGLTSVIERVWPCTRMPPTCGALPARYAGTPWISDNRDGPAEYRFCGDSDRSSVWRNVSAVTGSFDGGEKWKPARTRNV